MDTQLEAVLAPISDVAPVKDLYQGRHRRPAGVAPEFPPRRPEGTPTSQRVEQPGVRIATRTMEVQDA